MPTQTYYQARCSGFRTYSPSRDCCEWNRTKADSGCGGGTGNTGTGSMMTYNAAKGVCDSDAALVGPNGNDFVYYVDRSGSPALLYSCASLDQACFDTYGGTSTYSKCTALSVPQCIDIIYSGSPPVGTCVEQGCPSLANAATYCTPLPGDTILGINLTPYGCRGDYVWECPYNYEDQAGPATFTGYDVAPERPTDCIPKCFSADCAANLGSGWHTDPADATKCRNIAYVRSGWAAFSRGPYGALIQLRDAQELRSDLGMGAGSRLGAFRFHQYPNTIPEGTPTTKLVNRNELNRTASPNVHYRRNGWVDLFYLRGRDTDANNTPDLWEIRYIYSDDGGRTFARQTIDPYDNVTMAEIAETDFGGTTINATYRVIAQNIATVDYVKIVTALSPEGQLALFGWKAGKWYCRMGKQSSVAPYDWTLSAEAEVAATEDNTCQGAQWIGGAVQFYYYDTPGKLRLARGEGINPDTGAGAWVDVELLDALTENYLAFAIVEDRRSNELVLLAWEPNVLPALASTLGKWKVRVLSRQGDGTYTVGPEKLTNIAEFFIQAAHMIQWNDRAYEMRSHSAFADHRYFTRGINAPSPTVWEVP